MGQCLGVYRRGRHQTKVRPLMLSVSNNDSLSEDKESRWKSLVKEEHVNIKRTSQFKNSGGNVNVSNHNNLNKPCEVNGKIAKTRHLHETGEKVPSNTNTVSRLGATGSGANNKAMKETNDKTKQENPCGVSRDDSHQPKVVGTVLSHGMDVNTSKNKKENKRLSHGDTIAVNKKACLIDDLEHLHQEMNHQENCSPTIQNACTPNLEESAEVKCAGLVDAVCVQAGELDVPSQSNDTSSSKVDPSREGASAENVETAMLRRRKGKNRPGSKKGKDVLSPKRELDTFGNFKAQNSDKTSATKDLKRRSNSAIHVFNETEIYFCLPDLPSTSRANRIRSIARTKNGELRIRLQNVDRTLALILKLSREG